MKVVLFSNSDLTGGAAVVTTRLLLALQKLGVDASMLVLNKSSNIPQVHPVGSKLGRKIRFIAERAYIFGHNGFNRKDLFKVSVANTGFDLARHPLVKNANFLILGWINQGMLSLKDINHLASSGKPILWIMHDMWCMTGACHHALDCNGYLSKCGNCRYFHNGQLKNDLSRKFFYHKMNLYNQASNIQFIAVSNWLASVARKSSLLKGRSIKVIPNAFPVDDFYTSPGKHPLPDGIDTSKRLIVMGAARLDDHIKNFDLAIDSLNQLQIIAPSTANQCQAVFFGDLRHPDALDRLSFNHIHLGRLTNQSVIRELYANASIVLSTSRFETLPGTLIEGMAAGAIPVTTGNGGQRDIVTDGVNGFIAESTPQSISAQLLNALKLHIPREEQHSTIVYKFSATVVAQAIIDAATTNKTE